jgi:SAM-dependent methyltransferase
MPIDRMYVERFLASHAEDIRGHVLEIGAPDYTRKLGGTRVEKVDVLHAKAGNPEATIVGDLVDAPQIPSDTFDCAILTQVLQYVYDVRDALATLHRILAPGGVLLATAPGITKISTADDEQWGEWWHYTARSLRRLAGEAFGEENVEVQPFGNVLTAAGFLYGLAPNDLPAEDLEVEDPLYEVILGLRAVKTSNRGQALA